MAMNVFLIIVIAYLAIAALKTLLYLIGFYRERGNGEGPKVWENGQWQDLPPNLNERFLTPLLSIPWGLLWLPILIYGGFRRNTINNLSR